MRRLLAANLTCLLKNRTFRMCMGVTAAIAVLLGLVESVGASPDYVIFEGTTYIAMILSVCIGMFVGTEYSDGTIRNKILAGHSRWSVYFANFIVCTVAAIALYLTSILATVALALAIQWEFQMPAGVLIPVILCSFLPITAYTALFTLVCMLVCSRSEIIVASILIVIILLVAAANIDTALAEDGYISADEYFSSIEENAHMTEQGKEALKTVMAEQNKHDIGWIKHKVYLFLNDSLPSCQLTQITNFIIDFENTKDRNMWKKILFYSLLFIIVTTACGGYFFRKRNLK